VSDAARVDGASAWQGFWRITLPMLGHVLALAIVLLLVNSLQEYTLPYTLAGGGQAGSGFGPDNALVMLNLALYNQAFSGGILEFGVASAGAVLEFGVILVVSVLLLKVIRPKWSY
jgi:multiple sugar transport system permease protein